MREYFWLKITFVVFDSAINKRYVSRCFQKTTPWSKNMQMKGSKELLTCRFIIRSCIASLNPVVHFNLTLLVLSFSAHPEPGCVGWDLRDHQPLTSSRLATVKVLPDVPLTHPTSKCYSKAFFLAWNLPKGFLSLYPSIRSESQIRIRVCLDQLYKISIEAYLTILHSLPKDVLSSVLLLLSPGNE